MKTLDTTFWVLTEGATQEEQYDWATIEEMCRSGQLTADAQIFFPDQNKWVRAGETDLRPLFGAAAETVVSGGQEEEEGVGEAAALESEYTEALDAISRNPDVVRGYVEAGRVAAIRGDRELARDHFQKALELEPFNSRVANEVMRRFSKSECLQFQFLRREPPVWDEPGELLFYPLSRGPLYLAIPAAALLVLSFVPFGVFAAAPLAYLWCIQSARHTAGGATTLPEWNRSLRNPAREIILPLLAGALVAVQSILVVYGIGRAVGALTGREGTAFSHVVESPVLLVTLTLTGLVYLPAVLVQITHSVGIIVHLLNPYSVVRSMARIGQEYAVTALITVGLAFLLGGIRFLTGGIPVIGNIVFAAAAAWLIPALGLLLGRQAARKRHVL